MPIKWRYAFVRKQKWWKAIWNCILNYPMILPKSSKKSTYCRKASIDEFYLILREWIGLGCYQWTNELSQSITKETGLLSFALSVNKTVSKLEPANQNQ
jgi:hypothetical protein